MSRPTRAVIDAIMKQYANLNRVKLRGYPRKMKFDDERSRLYFIDGDKGEIFYIPHSDPSTSSADVEFPEAINVLQSAPFSAPPQAAMSREEELLRERQRISLSGISDFKIVAGGAIFFTARSNLYLFTDPGNSSAPSVRDIVSELRDANAHLDLCGTWLDMKHHPSDPYVISFVLNCNLYAASINTDTPGGTVTRLTSLGGPQRPFATADYILQEEFSQFSGQFWCPSGNAILLTVTDLSQQRRVTLLGRDGSTEEIPFPRTGDRNAHVVSLVTVSTPRKTAEKDGDDTSSSSSTVPVFRVLPVAAVIAARFPWAEYIPRLLWRNADTVFAVLLSRDQERCVHIDIPASAFIPVTCEDALLPENFRFTPAQLEAASAAIVTVWEHAVPWAWVEITDDIHLGAQIDIIGAHHIGPVAAAGDAYSTKEGLFGLFTRRRDAENPPWTPLLSSDAPAVGIKWGTSSLHEATNSVFYLIQELHGTALCRADLLSGSVVRLSPADVHVHSFTVDRAGKKIAYVGSSLSQRPGIFLIDAPEPFVVAPGAAISDWSAPRSVYLMRGISEGLTYPVAPRLSSVVNRRGYTIPIAVHVPTGEPPVDGWPLVLRIYGGPHVQLVCRSFDARCDAVTATLTTLGYVVLDADNQMANCLGLRAHSVCKHHMGRFEASDFVDIVKAAVRGDLAVPVDHKRVAVSGWSYGGYATLLCMCQASDVFKLGFAGAPVGDWRLYDTGYTERYMGLLDDHAIDYQEGCISTYARGFPDEVDRVFLAHGTLDENVHLCHTMAIIDAMVSAGKPYSLLLYPGERHGLRQNPASRDHYNITLIQTIAAHL